MSKKGKEGREVWQVRVTELGCGCSSPPRPPMAEEAAESSTQVQSNEGSSEKGFTVRKDGLREVEISLPLFQPLTLLPIREASISCHMKGGWYAEDQSLRRRWGGQSLMMWLSHCYPAWNFPASGFLANQGSVFSWLFRSLWAGSSAPCGWEHSWPMQPPTALSLTQQSHFLPKPHCCVKTFKWNNVLLTSMGKF